MSTFGAFTVTRASTKNVLGSAGTYVSVANNTPAFEFNTDGTYRGLLVEPGATNLMIRSQEFDNGAWDKTRSSISANATTSPDGNTTADELIEDIQTGPHHTNISFTVADSTTVTVSFFVKANTRLGCCIAIRQTNGATFKNAYFNLLTGAVTSADSGYTGRIVALPNGWYRCSITGDSGTGGLLARGYCFMLSTATATSTSYTGDGTSSIYVWQGQAETGSVATSYIVTTGSTASRSADSISLTSASSLIGQSAGSLYVEVESPSYTSPLRRVLSLSDGTANNRMNINIQSGTNRLYQLFVSNAGVTDANILQVSGATNISKISAGYALNDFVLYINGSQIGTDALSNVPATSRIDIGNLLGSEQFLGWIRSVALFPTRLANATLASLTA